jgi:hypothetical protein
MLNCVQRAEITAMDRHLSLSRSDVSLDTGNLFVDPIKD